MTLLNGRPTVASTSGFYSHELLFCLCKDNGSSKKTLKTRVCRNIKTTGIRKKCIFNVNVFFTPLAATGSSGRGGAGTARSDQDRQGPETGKARQGKVNPTSFVGPGGLVATPWRGGGIGSLSQGEHDCGERRAVLDETSGGV